MSRHDRCLTTGETPRQPLAIVFGRPFPLVSSVIERYNPKERFLHLDEKANGIEKLKQYIANFVDRRCPVAGGCPVMNTAIEADDGNPVLRARAAKALRFWLGRLQAIVEHAGERGETRSGVDPKAVATVIVASLEGALMMSRLKRNDEPLRIVQSHLSRYLENEVAVA